MPIKKKRVRLSVEEKIWILNHRKENPLISQNKIALDFSAKLKKTVDRTSVTKVLQKSDQLLAFHLLGNDPLPNLSNLTLVYIAKKWVS